MHNKNTERALLGCIIADSDYLNPVKRWIVDENVFYYNFHKMIWNTIIRLEKENRPIDTVSVIDMFPTNVNISESPAYEITEMVNVPSPSQAEYYAKQLYNYWLRRKIVKYAAGIQHQSQDNSSDITELLEKSYFSIGDLLRSQPTQSFELEQLLQETHESIFDHRGIIRTGIEKIDRVIFGMTRGEITIIAGRPSSGKTTTIANIARSLVSRGLKVMIFNREMPNVEMMKKFIAMESDTISYRNLRHGAASSVQAVAEAMEYIKENYEGKIFMYDQIYTLADTFREIKQIKPDVVIDDHIGLIEYPAGDKRDLRHKIGDTTKQYKRFAKADNICVILVSQLNRNIEHRIDNVPRLSDLAESGNLEQDAEIVAFIHYPWLSNMGEPDSDGRVFTQHEVQVIVSKNRYGTVGRVTLGYSGDSCKLFENRAIAQEWERKKGVL